MLDQILGLGNSSQDSGTSRNIFDMSNPKNAASWKLISNSLTPSIGQPRNPFDGVQQAASNAQIMQNDQQDRAQKTQKKNATIEWLKSSGNEDLAHAVETGAFNSAQGFSKALERQKQAKDKAASDLAHQNKRAWIEQNAPNQLGAFDAGIFSANDIGKQHQKAQAPNGGATYGKSPVYGTDPETGETILGVVGDDGTFKRLDTGGFDVANGFEKIDTGTEIILRDKRTGEIASVTPKENYQKKFDEGRGSVEGKAAGEAKSAYDVMVTNLPGLEEVVSELNEVADDATYTYAGQTRDAISKQLGLDPSDGAIARTKYIAMVDNQVLPLLRQTFGAAFTVKEGESLRATLGDPNKTPEEKKAVLQAFIDQKKRNIAAGRDRIDRAKSEPAPAQTQEADPLGIR